MADDLIDNRKWLDGYAAHGRGEPCPWGEEAYRLGWLKAREDEVAAEPAAHACGACGQLVDDQDYEIDGSAHDCPLAEDGPGLKIGTWPELT